MFKTFNVEKNILFLLFLLIKINTCFTFITEIGKELIIMKQQYSD